MYRLLKSLMLSSTIHVETIITFEESSYMFSETTAVEEICLIRSGYIQGTNKVQISGGT